ncbi:MAG: PqqD family protein [Thermoanaerobaculales bacterium]|jgi:hypothetical protein|nr:PqqD family protein [Thermoanaerobaculales bacterium]
MNTLEPRPGIVVRRIADEVLLVPTTGELAGLQKIFVLDEVGCFIWERLDGRRSLEEISRLIAGEFAVEEDRAHADVLDFTGALTDAGLVVSRAPVDD